MNPQILVLALICFSLFGLTPGFVEAQRQSVLRSPEPVWIVASKDYNWEYVYSDRPDRRSVVRLEYGDNGRVQSIKRWQVRDEPDQSFSYYLFRDDEMIMGYDSYVGGEYQQDPMRLTRLFSTAANPELRQQTLGGIELSFAALGCLGGRFLEDLFPENATTETPDAGGFRLEVDTKFGRAQAWLEGDHPLLPVRILIELDGHHMNEEGEVLGETLYNTGESDSGMVSKRIEFNAEEFDSSGGIEFYKRWRVQETYRSLRGIESILTEKWNVEDIRFNADDVSGEIRPMFLIEDGAPVQVEGAPQVPYVWSNKKQWAVPNIEFIADSGASGGRSLRFLMVLALIVVGVVTVAVLRFRGAKQNP